MQFYPHNIPSTFVGQAVSASRADTGSLINNFSAIPITTIATASIALNISGSRGADGTSQSVIGPKGDTGTRGVTGPRGNSVFILSGSWHTGSPCGAGSATCYEVKNWNPYSTSGTIRWTDYNGNKQTGTLGPNEQTFICSKVEPYEVPAADVIVTSCGGTCNDVCTSLPCSPTCPC